MVTILDALRGVNAYPVPMRTLVETGTSRGLDLAMEADADVLRGKAYNLAVADILLWLSIAPNVTQGGQSYSFSDEQRLQLRNRANALYSEHGEDGTTTAKVMYGYKGSRL